MAVPLPQRVAANASGDFYVEAGLCLRCCLPHGEAPDLLNDLNEPFDECFFRRQPQTQPEIEQAIQALWVSEIAGLRYGGTNPDIIAKLRALNCGYLCDHTPEGAEWRTPQTQSPPVEQRSWWQRLFGGRVTQFLRALLFMIGVLLLCWLPLSFLFRASLVTAWPKSVIAQSSAGSAAVMLSPSPLFWGVGLGRRHPRESWGTDAIWPTLDRDPLMLSLPLWLLAAVCLAWPVTSFVVRRRRRGRGFEVETKAADDPVAASGS